MVATFDFSNFKDFKAPELKKGDGSAALLPWDGLTRVKIEKAEPGVSQAGNETLKLVMKVHEETLDGNPVTGTLYNTMPISGVDSRGEPNARRFFLFLLSAGIEEAELTQMAEAGEQVTLVDLCDRLVKQNNVAYARVEARVTSSGKNRSDVKGFITQGLYEIESKAGNARNFRHHEPVAAAPAEASMPKSGFLA